MPPLLSISSSLPVLYVFFEAGRGPTAVSFALRAVKLCAGGGGGVAVVMLPFRSLFSYFYNFVLL